MAAFVPTMLREVERENILRFLNDARNNGIIRRNEINNISNLPEIQWFLWAVELLKLDGKSLKKIVSDFIIEFSKEALERFEVTKEIDWNTIPENIFNKTFKRTNFDNKLTIIEGQTELFKLLNHHFIEKLKMFKLLNEPFNNEIKDLAEELEVVNLRYNRMIELITKKEEVK